jgi:hypothetical protein
LVYGASDRRGVYPSLCPLSASDVVATIYYALGAPTDLELSDRLGRPILLPEGAPTRDVFA